MSSARILHNKRVTSGKKGSTLELHAQKGQKSRLLATLTQGIVSPLFHAALLSVVTPTRPNFANERDGRGFTSTA